MADKCLCCGKKIGVFSGAHLENSICDGCYFKFAGYVEEIKNMASEESVENKYINAVKIVRESDFLEEGIKHVIHYVDSIRDKRIEEIRKEQNEKEMSEALQELDAIRRRKYAELRANIMMTTGNNFEGYDIIEYCGVKSGNVVLGTGFLSELSASFGDFYGVESNKMSKKIDEAKVMADNKMIEKCIDAGGNAIIGIGYDFMTIANNMIVVSVNGTSVKIERSVK